MPFAVQYLPARAAADLDDLDWTTVPGHAACPTWGVANDVAEELDAASDGRHLHRVIEVDP